MQNRKIYVKISALIRMQFSRLFLVFVSLLMRKVKYSFPIGIGRREGGWKQDIYFPETLKVSKFIFIPQWDENKPCSYLHREKKAWERARRVKEGLIKTYIWSCYDWSNSLNHQIASYFIHFLTDTLFLHKNNLLFVALWHSTALVPEPSHSKRCK